MVTTEVPYGAPTPTIGAVTEGAVTEGQQLARSDLASRRMILGSVPLARSDSASRRMIEDTHAALMQSKNK